MQGEGRDDGMAARKIVPEPCVANLDTTGILRASRGRDLEHVRVDVDELDSHVGERIQDRRAERAGAGAEIDNDPARRDMALEPLHDRRDHPLVVRDERPDGPVVVGGGDTEVPGNAVLHRHRPSIGDAEPHA